jgi:hypothetical protein
MLIILSVKERLQTTLATYIILAARQFYILPKVAALITSEFPNEDVTGYNFDCFRGYTI